MPKIKLTKEEIITIIKLYEPLTRVSIEKTVFNYFEPVIDNNGWSDEKLDSVDKNYLIGVLKILLKEGKPKR